MPTCYFHCLFESYSMCFHFVQITGSKAANSAYYMLKLPSVCFYMSGVTPLKIDIISQYSCCAFDDFAVIIKFYDHNIIYYHKQQNIKCPRKLA